MKLPQHPIDQTFDQFPILAPLMTRREIGPALTENGIRHPENNKQLEHTTDGKPTVKFKPFIMGWLDK